jgi:putative pyruvate formate lyase activating enzyme
LANLTIWDDPAIRGALSWYLDVAENRRPAKFRIAATVATQLDPSASSEDALWVELDRLTLVSLARWQAIRAGAPLPQAADGASLLELSRELAYRARYSADTAIPRTKIAVGEQPGDSRASDRKDSTSRL